MVLKSTIYGFIGATALLVIYFFVVSLISGWSFAANQFSQFWYFIVSLAVGFGIQIGLYTHLKNIIHQKNVSGRALAVSGTTSTAAMLSCCAHYLVNILPIMGISGLAAIIGQYQTEIFIIGIVFNLLGIIYLAGKLMKYKTTLAKI